MIIHKYRLLMKEHQQVRMPAGAVLLDVQVQESQGVMLWAVVNPGREKLVSRHIVLRGTGSSFDEPTGAHIATVQMGVFVWHFFDRGEE